MILHRCFGMAAAMLLLSTAAQAADYRLTIAFDKTNPATPLIGEAFAKHLESASKGRMKIQINGPETVPSFDVAWDEYRMGLVHGFFLWGITQYVRPEVIAQLLRRLGTAAADHGSYDLLARST